MQWVTKKRRKRKSHNSLKYIHNFVFGHIHSYPWLPAISRNLQVRPCPESQDWKERMNCWTWNQRALSILKLLVGVGNTAGSPTSCWLMRAIHLTLRHSSLPYSGEECTLPMIGCSLDTGVRRACWDCCTHTSVLKLTIWIKFFWVQHLEVSVNLHKEIRASFNSKLWAFKGPGF